MFPHFFEVSLGREHLDAVGQNLLPLKLLLIREKVRDRIPFPRKRMAKRKLRLIPKTHSRNRGELFFEKAPRETPSNQKPLPHRWLFLSRIRGPNMGARQKVAIDLLLLDIEMVLITTGHKKKDQ